MRKYRIIESRLNNDLESIKKEAKEIELESKKVIENNENFLNLIKNYSLEQIIEMNRNK
nr:MAG TPA: hypothetical protein [Caudoviricetes sp.]